MSSYCLVIRGSCESYQGRRRVVERRPAIVAEQKPISNHSRQQLEGDLVLRADDAEVAAVKRCDFGDLEGIPGRWQLYAVAGGKGD